MKLFGFIFSELEISADPENVDPIRKAERRNSQSEVCSFLGMVGFVSRFIHDYSTITEPLRKLTKADGVPCNSLGSRTFPLIPVRKAIYTIG